MTWRTCLAQGKTGAKLKTDDSVEEVLHVMSHDSIVFFTEDGVARSLRAYQIPEASRTAVGAAITQARKTMRLHFRIPPTFCALYHSRTLAALMACNLRDRCCRLASWTS